MKKIVTIFVLFFLLNNMHAQIQNIDNSKDLLIFRFYEQDTLLINIDTAYIFNKRTFNLYNKAYDAYRTNKTCSLFYEPILLDLNNQIAFHESEYKKLNKLFDEQLISNEFYLAESNKNIEFLKNNNRLLSDNNIKLNDEIKALNKSYKWKMVKVGAISFGIGCTATTIAWLLLKK